MGDVLAMPARDEVRLAALRAWVRVKQARMVRGDQCAFRRTEHAPSLPVPEDGETVNTRARAMS